MYNETFLKKKNYKNFIFYKKTLCIYDITFYFAKKYLKRGDRTVDQMIQAARSGKQNIIEGTEAAMTSSETEIKLINVARASLMELLADYEDYARVHNLTTWDSSHPRYANLLDYCFQHNEPTHYSGLLPNMNEEEICNTAITLIHQTDAALSKYLKILQDRFSKTGGVREKMTQARLNAKKKK
ncbi:MAG: four helix bundle suffix domain-containing protein [Bacteroidales bacterium]|nr:four helix bundle suffix domain-containing protein [Bacteroidales bacterium]